MLEEGRDWNMNGFRGANDHVEGRNELGNRGRDD